MTDSPALITNELDVLAQLVDLNAVELIEVGCGNARLARELLTRFPASRVVGLEVDQRQHAKSLAAPQSGLTFIEAGAAAIPFPDGSFDGALMLKSLHHVPLHEMAHGLREIARVLRPGGWFYASEPVYAGALNEVIRLFNDEGPVRAAAQSALDEAVQNGVFTTVTERRFDMPVRFADFADFERRMMYPTFADHHITEPMRAAVRARFEPHMGADGARFTRPMLVRLLRRG